MTPPARRFSGFDARRKFIMLGLPAELARTRPPRRPHNDEKEIAMVSPPDILLIDANSIGYAAMYQPELAKLSKNGFCTAAMHGLPATVFRLMRRFPGATPMLLWDGQAQWRRDLYPDYKITRHADPAVQEIKRLYKAQGAYLRQIFHRMGFPQIAEKTTEADDIAGLIVRNAPSDLKVLMITTDSDWPQALRPNASILNPRTNVYIDLAHLATTEFKGGPFVDPDQYLTAKCLAGDDSDCITGVEGIGLKTGAKILNDFGSLQALWDLVDSGENFKSKRVTAVASEEGREIYLRNRRLMDWREAELPDEIRVYGAPADASALSTLAKEFELQSVASQGEHLIALAERQGWYDTWHRHGRLVKQIMIDRPADRGTATPPNRITVKEA